MLVPMRVALVSAFFLAGCRRESASPRATADCASCHSEIAREWGESEHRSSYSDPVYQRAFALEPLPFCTGCHAPAAPATDPGPSPAHLAGVGCLSCHDGAHQRRSAERTCAACHEFDFPDRNAKMQLTATEHARSRFASTACSACHMPVENGHRSHRFAASKDPALVRSAATITAVRDGQVVRVRFAPADVGHAFPTGDLFRRLHVVVENAAGARAEAFLDRKTKQATPDDPNAKDDRPFVHGPHTAEITLAAPAGALTWRVLYERVEHPLSDETQASVIDGVIEVAGGAIGE